LPFFRKYRKDNYFRKMKKITKILSLILVSAMILSLAGCTSSISGTRLFKAFELINADTFTYEIVLDIPLETLGGLGDEASIFLYRDGNNFKASFLGAPMAFVVNRELIDFDHGAKIIYYDPMSEQEYKNFLDGWIDEGLGTTWVEIKGARLLSSGRDTFQGEETYYEEFRDGNGQEARAFFDGDDIVGLRLKADGGGWSEIPFRIAASVPAGMFDLPEGYQRIRESRQ
jgi:hypothetical protein